MPNQDEKSSRSMTAPPSLIDEVAQGAEDFRHTVDFAEDHKPVFVLTQKSPGSESLRRFFQHQSEGRLADPTSPNQGSLVS